MLKSFYEKGKLEVGCDEAGRGCLAGPVFAGAVILPHDFFHPLLNDSKKITKKQRNILRPIIEKEALAFGVGQVGQNEIDEINILNASFLAMHRAIDLLYLVPESILVDGNRFKKYKQIPHHCIVKGDGKLSSIAAASILAKTYRDEYMEMIDEKFPNYGWKKNKGYPTKKHRLAIVRYGTTSHHRMSFKLLPDTLTSLFDNN